MKNYVKPELSIVGLNNEEQILAVSGGIAGLGTKFTNTTGYSKINF